MIILSFLYSKIFLALKIITFLFGILLCVFACKIPRAVWAKILFVYIGVIIGDLAGVFIGDSWIVTIVGVVLGIFAAYMLDKCFKNDGMLLISFVCIADIVYLLLMAVIGYTGMILDRKNDISESEMRLLDTYFDISSYAVKDRVFFVAVVIGLIVAVVCARRVKSNNTFAFMGIVIGTIQVFGTFFSYPDYPYDKVYDWEPVFLPLMNIDYEIDLIGLIVPIIGVSIFFYWVQKKLYKDVNLARRKHEQEKNYDII